MALGSRVHPLMYLCLTLGGVFARVFRCTNAPMGAPPQLLPCPVRAPVFLAPSPWQSSRAVLPRPPRTSRAPPAAASCCQLGAVGRLSSPSNVVGPSLSPSPAPTSRS